MKFTPSGTFFVPDRCTLISLAKGGEGRGEGGSETRRIYKNFAQAIGIRGVRATARWRGLGSACRRYSDCCADALTDCT